MVLIECTVYLHSRCLRCVPCLHRETPLSPLSSHCRGKPGHLLHRYRRTLHQGRIGQCSQTECDPMYRHAYNKVHPSLLAPFYNGSTLYVQTVYVQYTMLISSTEREGSRVSNWWTGLFVTLTEREVLYLKGGPSYHPTSLSSPAVTTRKGRTGRQSMALMNLL